MPDIKVEAMDQNIAVPTEDPVNFLAFRTAVNGKPIATQVEQRVFAMGLDRTQLLRSLGIPLAPHLKATYEALDRLPGDMERTIRVSVSPKSRNTTPARA